MPDEPMPYHSSMPIAAEFLVRQVVLEGLHEISADETRLREIVGRVDTLSDGSNDAVRGKWTEQLVAAYVDMLDPSSPDYVKVLDGLPFAAGDLPCVSIIKEAGAEDTAGAELGDLLAWRAVTRGGYDNDRPVRDLAGVFGLGTRGRSNLTRSTETRVPVLHEHRLEGVAFTTTVQVGSWTTAPELSLLLDAAVHDSLFRGKRRLITAGVQDVAFSEGGSPTDEEIQVRLRVGYVPSQRATIDWIRGTTRRKGPIPNRVRILPGIFTA